MSDTLKTAVSYINRWNRWDDGEQPTAEKFKFFFSAYSASLNTIANILGPSFDSSAIATTKERVVSSHSYESLMSAGEQEDFLTLANTQITNTFNLARVIGPHAVLNPQHLPGSVHKISGQPNSGQALATGTKQQQLAFPPIQNYNYTITGAPGWARAGSGNAVPASKEGVASALGKYFHIDDGGTLYSSQVFSSGAFIKYDLKVPNTYSYLGAGYNCIPDLSILTLADEDRLQDGEYGALRISYDSSYVSTSTSRWKVTLPKVTSLKDSVFKTNEKQVAADGYEPAGTYSITAGKTGRYYTLPTDLYLTSAGESYKIEDNLICLYDGRTKQSFMLKWEMDPNSELLLEDADGNLIQNAFYCYGPKNLESTLYDDSAAVLLSSNVEIYNSKDFFIFTLGSTITEQLAQTSLNFSRHRHDGSDSYRIHHNDLLGSQGELQGLGIQLGDDGGLNFINYNRQLAYSNAKDNVHPQYFHRLGYRYGGTQGKYENYTSFTKLLDLNAMQGDILFYPIDKTMKRYTYADIEAWNEEGDGDPIFQAITWDFTGTVSDVVNFYQRRGHAVIFGWPYDGSGQKYTTGATKLYYENAAMLSDTNVDNEGFPWTLSRHGFIPGDYTSPTQREKGLNIGWGNLFFGYREDIFGGRLTGSLVNQRLDANAYFKTGEFNIVTTANNYAGNNTNSKIKEGYNYRDGFAVRALRGSNIWLSTGAESEDLEQISSGKNTDGVPGTIALEASYPSSRSTVFGSETGTLSLSTLVSSDALGDTIGSGSGIFLAPGPFINTTGADSYRNPWVAATGESYKFASLWDSSSLGAVVGGNLLDGPAYGGPGSMLDIFALAPDRQKTNIAANGNIPVGRDSSLLGWVFGRPFIRGTYGINFCVNGTFLDIDTEFTSGYKRKLADQEWGSTNAVLKTLTNEYIHREFKFWGKNHNTSPVANADSYENTMGGNINLLYNFGRDYNRFGISQVWSSSTSLSGGGVGLSGDSQWSNSRRISLGSSKPEDYGSAIRQASYVEAFKGFRNDPLQPYYANYIIPFTASYILPSGTEVDVENQIRNRTFVLADNINGMPTLSNLNNDFALLSLENIFDDVTLDGLIRGSEEILLQNNYTISGAFPSSLVDFKVKLEYYVGQKTDGTSVNTGSSETPNGVTGGGDAIWYNRIYTGAVTMQPAAAAAVSGAGGTLNKIPVVASDGRSDSVSSDRNSNAIVGYSSAIGVLKNTNIGTSSTGYRSKFPLFESIGRGDVMGQKQFCLLLNIYDSRIIETDALINSPVPYRIVKDEGDNLLIKFRGTIHITTMTAYSRNPIGDFYTHP